MGLHSHLAKGQSQASGINAAITLLFKLEVLPEKIAVES